MRLRPAMPGANSRGRKTTIEGHRMTGPLTTLDFTQWNQAHDPATSGRITHELETGSVLYLPRLKFELTAGEQRFLSPRWSDGKAKNVSYDPPAAQIRHTSAQAEDRRQLAAMIARFAGQARELVLSLCPRYAGHLRWGL